ncbi:MAG: membrane protein insertase YidC, partial [Pirellulales bacterium]
APTDAPGGKGLLVGVVGPGSPAAEAGVKEGDIITALEDKPVRDVLEFQSALAKKTPKDSVALSLLRGTEKLSVTAKLSRHPMQVVRPEIENSRLRREDPPRGESDPLSLVFTLWKIDDEQIGADGEEIPGLSLRDGNWEILDGGQPAAVTFRKLLPKHALDVRKTYQLARSGEQDEDLPGAGYHLKLSVEVRNTGQAKRQVAYRLDGPTGLPTEGAWYVRIGLRDFVVGIWNDEKEAVTLHTVTTHEVTAKPQDNAGVRDDATGQIKYIGVNTQYFASVLLPRQGDIFQGSRPVAVGEIDEKMPLITNVTCRLTTKAIALEPDASFKHEYALFAGPKEKEVLEAYQLDPLVDYGWRLWAWIARILQRVLHFFYALVGNYGLAIIMLTALVRLAMFPLSRKQVLGAQKMQELQPEIRRISEQYKKNLEARNRAMSDLFRKHQYHPLSGCLPVFVQLPVFIGLYNSLSVDIMARDAPLFPGIQWCSNLAAPDMLLDWSSWMPRWVQDGAFLFPGLGPFLNVLPIITIVLFIVQQKMFMPPPTNEQQAMQQKLMKYMMIVIGLMFYKVASGLCLYFIASSLWGLAERKLMPKVAPATAGQPAPATPLPPTTGNGSAAARKKKRKQRRER